MRETPKRAPARSAPTKKNALPGGKRVGEQANLAGLEVELVDVALVEDEGLSEEDVVALDLEGAERAGLEGLGAGLELVLGDGDAGVGAEVAEVHRVPEDDAVGHAFMDVALVLVGQAEADDLHLAGLAGLL